MTRRFDRYVLQEILPPFLFAVVLYTSLAVATGVLQRLSYLGGTGFFDLLAWIALFVPQAWVQTAPLALVLAVLLAFGRLGADHELTAARAGGVALFRPGLWAVGLATLVALLAFASNEFLVPRANAAAAERYWQLAASQSGLFRLVGQQVPLGGYTLHVSAVSSDERLLGVRLEGWNGDVLTLIRAEHARFDGGTLALYGHRTQRFELAGLDLLDVDPAERLASLVRLDARSRDGDAPLVVSFGTTVAELIAQFGGGGFEDPRSIRRLFADASDLSLGAAARLEATVLGHRRLAEPVSNIALLLMAVPLSLSFARSRSLAFALALVMTVAWYVFYLFGQVLSLGGVLPPALGPWAANLLLGGAGVGLMLFRGWRPS
jgi:lipopolysaccharide export LptBFGC system permease protein LptF